MSEVYLKKNATVTATGKGQIFCLEEDFGSVTIYNSSNLDALNITYNEEWYENPACFVSSINYSKKGNDLVLMPSYENSITLKNFFSTSSSEKNVLKTINGIDIIEKHYLLVQIEGTGTIKDTLFDDDIYGSDKADKIYTTSGVNSVFAGGGNDKIYGNEYGIHVDTGSGNDAIYCAKDCLRYDFNENGGYIINKDGEFKFDNVFEFYQGHGHDTIYNSCGNDQIQFYGIEFSDLSFEMSGADLLIKHHSDSVRLVDYFKSNDPLDMIYTNPSEYDPESIWAENRISTSNVLDFTINGSPKKDTLYAQYNGNAIINPLKGNDTIYIGGTGNKTINIQAGLGHTTIYVNQNTSGEITLNLNEELADQLCYVDYSKSADGKDLIIYNNYDGIREIIEPITIKGFFENGLVSKNIKLINNSEVNMFTEILNQDFVNTTTWTVYLNENKPNNYLGTDQNEAIFGEDKFDVIDAGNGNNYIQTGQRGNNTLSAGDGFDQYIISNYSGTHSVINDRGGEDQLILQGIKKGDSVDVVFDVTCKDELYPELNPDLLLGVGSSQKIRIENWFAERNNSTGEGVIESIITHFCKEETPGVFLELENYIQKAEQRVKTWLENNGYEDKTAFWVMENEKPSVAKDLIAQYTMEGAEIHLNNFSEEQMIFNGTNKNDYILVSENITVNGGNGNDKLLRSETGANYVLNGDAGNDILQGGDNTILNGGVGENVILIDEYTNATITQGKGKDYIHFTNESLENFNFIKRDNDLVIEGSSSECVLKDYFKYNTKSSIKGFTDCETIIDNSLLASEIVNAVKGDSITLNQLLSKYDKKITVQGTDASEIIKGTDYDEIIYANGSDDKIYGNGGKNTIVFESGHGTDTVFSGKGIDTLEFSEEVIFTKNQNDLEILYGDNDKVIVKNYLSNPEKSSVKYITVNGNTENLSDVIELTINESGSPKGKSIIGTNATDKITGTHYNDTIKGGNGDDIINAGTGSDKIYGEGGTNTLLFKEGDGQDTIYMGKDVDRILLDENISSDTLTYERVGNNFVIGYGTKGDTITIANYFNTTNKTINSIDFGSLENPNEPSIKTISLNKVTVEGKEHFNEIIDGWGYYYTEYVSTNSSIGHFVNTTDKRDIVKLEEGNDSIQIQSKGITEIYNNGGNDTYRMDSLKYQTFISDFGGDNDKLILSDSTKNLTILFEVQQINGIAQPISDDLNSLFIINNTAKNWIINNRSTNTSGIEIDDYLGSNTKGENGAIETIQAKDGYITLDDIEILRDNVAGWLYKHDYSSSMQVLEGGTAGEVKDLLNFYQSEANWQQLQ